MKTPIAADRRFPGDTGRLLATGSMVAAAVIMSRLLAADPAVTAPEAAQVTSAPQQSPQFNRVNEGALQQRLTPVKEPVKVEGLDASGGVVGAIGKDSKAPGLLEWFNPFAPASLGTAGAMTPGFADRNVPRVFRDDKTDGPSGLSFFRWWFRRDPHKQP